MLQGANLRYADFDGAILEGADLGRDRLGGSTHVQGANFRGAIMEKAMFEVAEYDSETRFPDGFDPTAQAMVFRPETTS